MSKPVDSTSGHEQYLHMDHYLSFEQQMEYEVGLWFVDPMIWAIEKMAQIVPA